MLDNRLEILGLAEMGFSKVRLFCYIEGLTARVVFNEMLVFIPFVRNIRTQPNIKNRIIATIVDYGIYLTFWSIYVYSFGSPNDEGGYTVSGMKALPLFASWFLYFPVVESIGGQTLGHRIVGIRVIGKFGDPISFLQSLKRRVFDPIDLFVFFGLIGYLTVKKSDNHQRAGDIVAGTIVVGGESATCQHCGEQLTLSPEDKIRGRFSCPSCNNENEN